MNAVRLAAVSLLLLAAFSVCSIARNSKNPDATPQRGGNGCSCTCNTPPFPPWPPHPPFPPFSPLPPHPPFPPWPPLRPFTPWPPHPPFPPFSPWPPHPPFPPFSSWPPHPPFPPFSPWPPFPPGGRGGCSCTCNTPPPRPPKKFIVGGAKKWSFGTNYTEWALSNGPFYVGDTLEFIYPPPVDGRPYNHSVHLLRDYHSFQSCNLDGSLRIGDEYAGGGSNGGFMLKLEPWAPFYLIACGEKQGIHCNVGTMKLFVMPLHSGRFKH